MERENSINELMEQLITYQELSNHYADSRNVKACMKYRSMMETIMTQLKGMGINVKL